MYNRTVPLSISRLPKATRRLPLDHLSSAAKIFSSRSAACDQVLLLTFSAEVSSAADVAVEAQVRVLHAVVVAATLPRGVMEPHEAVAASPQAEAVEVVLPHSKVAFWAHCLGASQEVSCDCVTLLGL